MPGSPETRPALTDLIGIFALAFSTLVFELAYNKIVVVQNYGRLGYIVIGTALLGFAVSGVLLSCWSWLGRVASERLVMVSSLACGLSMLFAYLLTSVLPLDFTKFFDRPVSTVLCLAGWYVALTLPFFFAGLAICSLLGRGERGVGWLYGSDLVGAGIGAVLAVFAAAWLGGAGTVWAAAVICLVSAAIFSLGRSRLLVSTNVVLAVVLTVVGVWLVPQVGIVVHTPKRGYAEDRDGDSILLTRWSAISRIDVADRGDHRMIWFDAGSMQSHVFPFGGDVEQMPSALPMNSSGVLPYRMKQRDRVLVLASSGGKEVLWALAHGAKDVTAVELDPSVCDLVANELNVYLGGLFHHPSVSLVNEEGRSFVKRSPERYDVIQQLSAYSITMVTTGAAASADSYLLTVEAICDYYDHLSEDGILYLSKEHGPKLFATVLAACDRMGVDIEGRLYMEKGLNTYNYNALMLKRTPFTDAELSVLAEHVRRNNREVFHAPKRLWAMLGAEWEGAPPDPNGRSTVATLVSLGPEERARFIDGLPYVSTPPTDDRPFYHRVFPFLSRIDATLPGLPLEIQKLAKDARRFGPVPIGDVPSVAVLGEALLMAGLIIFVPLWRLRGGGTQSSGRLVMLVYFSLLGVGFIALEVILLQRFILFVGSPTIAMAIVLGSLLVFAGLGSAFLSPLVVDRPVLRIGVFALIGLLALVYGTQMEWMFGRWLGYGLLARCLLGVGMLLPLGLLLGVPFPVGLRFAGRADDRLVAWAWALNGYMTVIGTTGISIVIQFVGYRSMFLASGLVYVLAGVCMLSMGRRLGRPAR